MWIFFWVMFAAGILVIGCAVYDRFDKKRRGCAGKIWKYVLAILVSLILMLLQKNKIEIRDLSISDILNQYLAWLDEMQRLDLEVTSEFVRMAAYLLYIKTQTLLSSEEEVTELEALMQSLETLKCRDMLTAVKGVVPQLGESYKLGALMFSKSPEPLPASANEYAYMHQPVELLQALLRVFSATAEKPVDYVSIVKAVPQRIVYSVRDKSRQILGRLRLRNLGLNELYSECTTRSELVATFIAVLELCNIGSIMVSVSRKGDGYDLSFAGGDVDEILEKIEE